jgi:hypothetical protein
MLQFGHKINSFDRARSPFSQTNKLPLRRLRDRISHRRSRGPSARGEEGALSRGSRNGGGDRTARDARTGKDKAAPNRSGRPHGRPGRRAETRSGPPKGPIGPCGPHRWARRSNARSLLGSHPRRNVTESSTGANRGRAAPAAVGSVLPTPLRNRAGSPRAKNGRGRASVGGGVPARYRLAHRRRGSTSCEPREAGSGYRLVRPTPARPGASPFSAPDLHLRFTASSQRLSILLFSNGPHTARPGPEGDGSGGRH